MTACGAKKQTACGVGKRIKDKNHLLGLTPPCGL